MKHWLDRLYHVPPALYAALFATVHLIVSLYYRYAVGFRIDVVPGDTIFWNRWPHTVPAELLLERPLESIWYFHGQPPLFNVLGVFLANMSNGDGTQMIEYLYTVNMFAGMLTVAAIFLTAWYLFKRWRWLALLIGVAVTFSPSVIGYQAFFPYASIVGMFAALMIMGVARYQQTNRLRDLALAIVALNLLVLTRSAYHPVLLIPVIMVLCIAAGDRWLKMLGISALASSVTVIWLVKNAVLFGFIGMTSWTGLNLWQHVGWGYDVEELQQLAADGVIDPMVAEQAGFFTFYYDEGANYIDYGFDKTSDIPVLSEPNLNGINVPDISDVYLDAVMKLIAHDPARYVQRVVEAYGIFSCPPASFFLLDGNVYQMGRHAGIYYQLEGYRLFEGDSFLIPGVNVNPCSFTFFTLPLSVIVWVGLAVLTAGLSPRRWLTHIHRNPLMWVLFGMIVYTTLVGTLTEYLENTRFRYPIEFMLWIFYAGIVYYVWGWWRNRQKEKSTLHS